MPEQLQSGGASAAESSRVVTTASLGGSGSLGRAHVALVGGQLRKVHLARGQLDGLQCRRWAAGSALSRACFLRLDALHALCATGCGSCCCQPAPARPCTLTLSCIILKSASVRLAPQALALAADSQGGMEARLLEMPTLPALQPMEGAGERSRQPTLKGANAPAMQAGRQGDALLTGKLRQT